MAKIYCSICEKKVGWLSRFQLATKEWVCSPCIESAGIKLGLSTATKLDKMTFADFKAGRINSTEQPKIIDDSKDETMLSLINKHIGMHYPVSLSGVTVDLFAIAFEKVNSEKKKIGFWDDIPIIEELNRVFGKDGATIWTTHAAKIKDMYKH